MPGQLDVDHMVPLKNAWISGAHAWTREQRQAYANDMTNPQLWSVSAASNRSKADKSPDRWMPPEPVFACQYSKAWTQVKHTWKLRITPAEKAKLRVTIATCTR